MENLSGELNNLRKNLNSLQSSIGKGDEDVKNQLSAFLQVKFLNEFQHFSDKYKKCKHNYIMLLTW